MTHKRDDGPPPSEDLCSETGLEALSSAFALIACADAELADSEIERFRDVIREAEACRGLDLAEVERTFQELSAKILEDFSSGKEQALAIIRAAGTDDSLRERILSAAQIAIVADGRLREVEEAMLREICHAVGVDPDDY